VGWTLNPTNPAHPTWMGCSSPYFKPEKEKIVGSSVGPIS